jgi:hypothetical protein
MKSFGFRRVATLHHSSRENSAGQVALGKFLIQIGMSDYRDGYHVHIHEDFNADKPEIMAIGVNNTI